MKAPSRAPCRSPARPAGFTLVECLVACAVAGVLAAVAVPGWQAHERRSARQDAVTALTRVQLAQERHRQAHGQYSSALAGLGLPSASPQGQYALRLQPTGPQGYRVSAVATGAQARDTGCSTITLDVQAGFPTEGPDAGCWRR